MACAIFLGQSFQHLVSCSLLAWERITPHAGEILHVSNKRTIPHGVSALSKYAIQGCWRLRTHNLGDDTGFSNLDLHKSTLRRDRFLTACLKLRTAYPPVLAKPSLQGPPPTAIFFSQVLFGRMQVVPWSRQVGDTIANGGARGGGGGAAAKRAGVCAAV